MQYPRCSNKVEWYHFPSLTSREVKTRKKKVFQSVWCASFKMLNTCGDLAVPTTLDRYIAAFPVICVPVAPQRSEMSFLITALSVPPLPAVLEFPVSLKFHRISDKQLDDQQLGGLWQPALFHSWHCAISQYSEWVIATCCVTQFTLCNYQHGETQRECVCRRELQWDTRTLLLTSKCLTSYYSFNPAFESF